jgi:hypothetical protein
VTGSNTTIRRSAIYGPGGRYQFMSYQQIGVTLEDVIIRTDGGWGEGGTSCTEWEPNAPLNAYDSNDFACINCITFDGIVTATGETETLGGLGVNCHGSASGALFENSLVAGMGSSLAAARFYADGNGSCANVTLRDVYARAYTRNVNGTTTVERGTFTDLCAAWDGSVQLVDSRVGGNQGCSGSTTGAGASITLNASFLDNPRWRREMCDSVTRGWCGTDLTLSEYLRGLLP